MARAVSGSTSTRSRSACAAGSRLSSRDEPEHRRAPHGDAERCPDHRVDVGQWLVRRGAHRGVDDDAQLAGRCGQDGVDQLVLAGEPVQDRLLAHTDTGRDLVEGDAVDTAPAEQIERRGEDAFVGRPDAHGCCLPFGRETW